jgi:hypothetical protein
MSSGSNLDATLDELYGLDPTEFTARRDGLAADARKAGDRELAAATKALRRPSVAAAAVNRMVRSEPEEIERLTTLGSGLRKAQEELSGDDLRALGRQRQQLIGGLVQQARRLADRSGRPITDAAAREVEATFEAALADEAAGRVVRQGRLVRSLQRSGMDPVDLEGAAAGPASPSAPMPRPRAAAPPRGRESAADAIEAARAQRQADQNQRQADRETARAQAEAADAQLAHAQSRYETAQQRRADAGAAVLDLQQRLAAARDQADQAAAEEDEARQARLAAEETAQTAREQADALRR